MVFLLFILLACPEQALSSREMDCKMGYQGYGPRIPSCWEYLPCSDMVFSLTDYTSASCRPDQDSSVQWEPQNGPRTENEDRVGGVLVCTCKSTP